MKSKQLAAQGAWIAGGVLAMVVGVVVPASAQPQRYEGEIIALDTTNHTFTVKASEPGEAAQQVFVIGGGRAWSKEEQRALGDLALNEQVIVSYAPVTEPGATPAALRVDRLSTDDRASDYAGVVSAVDATQGTFTLSSTRHGKTETKTFQITPFSIA